MIVNPKAPGRVLISTKEYEALLQDAYWRQCLEDGGVDNWQWYSESLQPFYKKYYPKDLDKDDD